jgi:hypothetical protein
VNDSGLPPSKEIQERLFRDVQRENSEIYCDHSSLSCGEARVHSSAIMYSTLVLYTKRDTYSLIQVPTASVIAFSKVPLRASDANADISGMETRYVEWLP